MHRLGDVRRGDVDVNAVLRIDILRHDEAETRGVDLQPAFDFAPFKLFSNT